MSMREATRLQQRAIAASLLRQERPTKPLLFLGDLKVPSEYVTDLNVHSLRSFFFSYNGIED